MAITRTIELTYEQYDALLTCLRVNVSEIQRLRHQAEAKGLDGAVELYNEDIEKVHALRDHLINEYNDNPGSIGEGIVLSNGINPYTTGPKLIVRMQLPPNAPFKIGDKVRGRYKLIGHREE